MSENGILYRLRSRKQLHTLVEAWFLHSILPIEELVHRIHHIPLQMIIIFNGLDVPYNSFYCFALVPIMMRCKQLIRVPVQ
jgi:hypothetical protein